MAGETPVTDSNVALNAILHRISDTNDSIRDVARRLESMRDTSVQRSTFELFTTTMGQQFIDVKRQFTDANKRFDGVDTEIARLKKDDSDIRLEEQRTKLPTTVIDIIKFGSASVLTALVLWLLHGGHW